jgi:hypothetical protein
MSTEITSKGLAAAYLQQLQGIGPTSAESFDALYFWEDLIVNDPEKAWPVFIELLTQPQGDDTLEQISYRLELLLSRHWESFHLRVGALVHGHEELPRFLPDEALAWERYQPRDVTNEEIAQAYLEYDRQRGNRERLEKMIAKEPLKALPIVLEIINRGQLQVFRSFDLSDPLLDLLRQHGEVVISQIEREAANSVMLRRCLWQIRRRQENGRPWNHITELLWARVELAADETTDFNSHLPDEIRSRHLTGEGEELLLSWFAYKQTSWSVETLLDLSWHNPERLWVVIKALVAAAPDEQTLSYIGAWWLEDLLADYGSQFIERIEDAASTDPKFRLCLAGVWKTTMNDDLWQRLTSALGDQERY